MTRRLANAGRSASGNAGTPCRAPGGTGRRPGSGENVVPVAGTESPRRLVVGPQELPRMMRTVGQYVGRIRAMARDFQRSFDEIARESELEELRKEVNALKAHNPVNQIKKSIEEETRPPIEKAACGNPGRLKFKLNQFSSNAIDVKLVFHITRNAHLCDL